MSDVRDIVLNLSTDVEEVNFFYYRIKGSGELYRRIDIKTPDTTYHIKGKAIQQLFKYLPLKYSNVKDIRDWKERNRILLETLRSTDKNLIFSVDTETNTVIRVVSSEFIPIPHKLIIEAVDEALGNTVNDFEREINYDYGMFATWTLNVREAKLGEEYKYRIYTFNRNDGSHSLRIGSGALILVCSNGLLRFKGYSRIHIRHTTELEQVRAKIQEVVDRLLDDEKVIGELIYRARKIEVSMENVKKFLKGRFPIWIIDTIEDNVRSYIMSRNKKRTTAWELSQAITYTATHVSDITQRYRIELQELGGRVLEDEKLIKVIA